MVADRSGGTRRVGLAMGGKLRPDLLLSPLACLIVFWVVLSIAGGASRGNVLGQVLTRAGAILVLGGWVLAGVILDWRRYRVPMLILSAAGAVALVQLVPLPAGVWEALPGRTPFLALDALLEGARPMRPLTLVPDATINALFSLVVPLVVLVGMMALGEGQARFLQPVLLASMVWSAFLALVQVSTGGLDNPLINNTPGDPAGLFANHNHQALFLAIGLLLAPSWGTSGRPMIGWRTWAALVMVVGFMLMIVASGSRAGLFLGLVGLLVGGLLVRRDLARVATGWPRFTVPLAVAGLIAAIVGLVWIGLDSDRARSIDRLLALETGADMRGRALPVVAAATQSFFPAGSGMGSFDAMFRMREPLALLKPTYFNHAHNDWLEVVLEAGLAGLAIQLGALIWWARASWRAWRHGGTLLARQGSAIIGLVMVASIVDYPARTPMIMAVLMVGACWLAARPSRSPAVSTGASARPLPKAGQHL